VVVALRLNVFRVSLYKMLGWNSGPEELGIFVLEIPDGHSRMVFKQCDLKETDFQDMMCQL